MAFELTFEETSVAEAEATQRQTSQALPVEPFLPVWRALIADPTQARSIPIKTDEIKPYTIMSAARAAFRMVNAESYQTTGEDGTVTIHHGPRFDSMVAMRFKPIPYRPAREASPAVVASEAYTDEDGTEHAAVKARKAVKAQDEKAGYVKMWVRPDMTLATRGQHNESGQLKYWHATDYDGLTAKTSDDDDDSEVPTETPLNSSTQADETGLAAGLKYDTTLKPTDAGYDATKAADAVHTPEPPLVATREQSKRRSA